MEHIRIAIWVSIVLLGIGQPRAAAPPSPTAAAPAKTPSIKAKSATELTVEGLPAISADGTRVAYVASAYAYDDSSSETLIIENIGSGKAEKSVILQKTEQGGEKRMSLKKVREALQVANQLVKQLRPLPPYELRKKAADADAGEKPYPYYRYQLGTRQLAYSLRSGRLELSDGKTVLLKETIKTARSWECCDRADRSEGGCKRPPDTVEGVWGEDRVLVVFFGFTSGPDGCEVDQDRRVFALPAAPAAQPAK